MSDERKEFDLPAGRIRYREAGAGKPVVFVHGYLVDGRLWDGVVDRLSATHRCIAPDWPMGAQQVPMSPAADLSPPGVARIVVLAGDTTDGHWSRGSAAPRWRAPIDRGGQTSWSRSEPGNTRPARSS